MKWRRRSGFTWAAGVVGAGGVALACSSVPALSDSQNPQTPAASWERQVGTAFENRGVARVERLGARWVLTVLCDGTHSTYLDDTKIDLNSYARTYVNARYTWVTRQVDVQCPMAPCPRVNERRIALERLAVVTMTDERAGELARSCQ